MFPFLDFIYGGGHAMIVMPPCFVAVAGVGGRVAGGLCGRFKTVD